MFRLRQLLMILTAAGGIATAQTTPFTVTVAYRDTTIDAGENGTLTLYADGLGLASTASVTVTNRNNTSAELQNFQLIGVTDFSITNPPELPVTLAARGSMNFTIQHLPASSARTSGRVAFTFSFGTTARTFNINLVGTAPEFGFSYTPQGGNATNILTGGTIAFTGTAIDVASTTTVVVTNRGTASGKLGAISLTGLNFQTAGIPLPDTSVDAGRDIRFTITYTPKSLDQVQGTLSVTLPERRVTFRLEAAAQSARFVYEAATPAGTGPVTPGGSIALPDVLLNDRVSAVVRVRNAGNFEGRITALSVSGAGFTLSDTPILPFTVPVNGTFAFTLQFAPTQAGRVTGRLRVGSDDFDVAGNGVGAALTYSYAVGSSVTVVAPNGAINVTTIPVGESTSVQFSLQNTGTAVATVNTIGLGTTTTVFTLGALPALPLRLEPNQTASFSIGFTPTAQGAATTTLRVDSQSFTVNAFANAPAALPAIRFEGALGAQDALSQPAIGVAIASAYALPLNGTLTLAFNSDVFANDPSVQFATGGRTVSFTIPAGATRAVFPNNANTIRVQTGTIAGTVTLTPGFSTEGGINLTPTTPPTASITVAPAAPRVLGVVLAGKTAGGLTLQISGYATARSVTNIELQFSPRGGENVSTTRLTVPAEPAFLGWFQGGQSAQFGSLFSVTVPLTLQGTVNASGENPSDTIQSISVVLANRVGSSAAASLNLR